MWRIASSADGHHDGGHHDGQRHRDDDHRGGRRVPTAAPARPARWVDLQAGDCLADPPPEDPSVVYVTVVDCATPHSAQVFHRGGLRVNAALADIARTECDAGLRTFTGQGASGRYAVTFLIDSRQDRTDNNPIPSDVICVLTDPGGAKLTGSAGH